MNYEPCRSIEVLAHGVTGPAQLEYRWSITIAHEMAHVLLDMRAVSADGHDEQELMTDTVAALAGFGRIMLAGC